MRLCSTLSHYAMGNRTTQVEVHITSHNIKIRTLNLNHHIISINHQPNIAGPKVVRCQIKRSLLAID